MNTNTEREELARIIRREYNRAIDRRRPTDAYDAPADAILAAGYHKPRTITTAGELAEAINRSFEEGENLVLLTGWRPWVIWESALGDIRVSSLPVEGDPEKLDLSNIDLPATVLHAPEPTK